MKGHPFCPSSSNDLLPELHFSGCFLLRTIPMPTCRHCSPLQISSIYSSPAGVSHFSQRVRTQKCPMIPQPLWLTSSLKCSQPAYAAHHTLSTPNSQETLPNIHLAFSFLQNLHPSVLLFWRARQGTTGKQSLHLWDGYCHSWDFSSQLKLWVCSQIIFSDLPSFSLLSYRISQTRPYFSHPTLLRTQGKVRHRPLPVLTERK